MARVVKRLSDLPEYCWISVYSWTGAAMREDRGNLYYLMKCHSCRFHHYGGNFTMTISVSHRHDHNKLICHCRANAEL